MNIVTFSTSALNSELLEKTFLRSSIASANSSVFKVGYNPGSKDVIILY